MPVLSKTMVLIFPAIGILTKKKHGPITHGWNLQKAPNGTGKHSLIFQLPIYLEPSSQLPIYQVTRPPGSKYIGNWKMRDLETTKELGFHLHFLEGVNVIYIT